MRRKFKYFGLVPIMLSAFLTTSVVVSCGQQEGLSHIEVTSLPNTTTYAVGSSFRRSGLEVTAYYYSGESNVLSSSDYTYEVPDMTTAGTKEVVISYTEDEVTVTTSFEITVYENNVTDISISDEFTVGVGDDLDNIYVPVYASYEDGSTQQLSEDEYDVFAFANGEMTQPVLGSFIAQYKTNASIYDEVRTLRFEGEHADSTGAIKLGEQSYNGTVYSVSAYCNTGNSLDLGTLTFDFTAVDAGYYDLSLNVAHNYVFNESANGGYTHEQQPLAINTVANLKVNGTSYDIEDTAIHNLCIKAEGLIYILGANYGYQLVRLGNVPLNAGTNSIELELVASKIGQVQTRWGYSENDDTQNGFSPSINIDYLRIDEAPHKEIVGIQVVNEPDQTSYLTGSTLDTTGLEVHAVYDDGTTAQILEHTYTVDTSSVDTTTTGTKTVNITYITNSSYTTSYDVTIVNEPDSIRIDTDNYTLNFNDNLDELSVPVIATLAGQDTVLAETAYTVEARINGQKVSGRAGFDTYTIVATYNANESITAEATYPVTTFTYNINDFDGTNIPTITSSTTYGYEYMQFTMGKISSNVLTTTDITVNFPSMTLPAGTVELSMDMLNLFVSASGSTYTTQDLDLSKIMTVTLNSASLTLEDSTVTGGTSYSGVSAVMSEDNIINKKLVDITLTESTTANLSITFTYNEDVVNTWNECSIVITNFYLTKK